MTIEELKKYLLDNPSICHAILNGAISCTQGGDTVGRLLSEFKQNGYKVTVEVDDDSLTPEQRHQRDADLADKAIRVLMSVAQGQGGR